MKIKNRSVVSLLIIFISSSNLAWAAETQTTTEVIELNNKGVRCLDKKEFDQAISYLRQAVDKDPTYKMARENLAIAINNKGLDIYAKGSAEGCLHHMESSFFDDSKNKTTLHNLEGIIRVLKLNPDSPVDRAGLSGKALLRGDGKAAWIEFCAAFQKLFNIFFPPKPIPVDPEPELPYKESADVFYKTFGALIEKRIRKNWKAPHEEISYTSELFLTIKNNGDIIIDTPLENNARNNAFKTAIAESAPAPKLYKNDLEQRMRFTFKYALTGKK